MEGNSLEDITVEEIEEHADNPDAYEVVGYQPAGRYMLVFLRKKPLPMDPAEQPVDQTGQ